MNSNLRTATSIFALAGFVAFTPTTAFAADEGMENAPIVVTAQRREEKQVDVPITITALNQQALQTANIQNLPDIVKLTPALRFDNAGGFFQPTIRGVGTPVATSGGGSNVGIYVDGFYSPNPLASDFKLMNVDSIQVLKGPQGTLFGHNTTGGAILVQTAEPSTTTAAKAKLSYGRFNEFKAQAYATTGITDNVALDIEGMYSRGDGYLTNISNGERVGDNRDWSVRVGVKADLTDRISVLLRYQHSHVNDPTPLLTSSYFDPSFGSGAPNYAAPGEVTFNRREVATGTLPEDQEYLHINSNVVQGTIKADLGFADLTSYTQYRREIVDSNIELDYSGAPVFELVLPNRNRTVSQELLLTSNDDSKLKWTAGFFYFSNKDVYLTYFSLAGINVLGIGPANPAGSPTGVVGVPFSPFLRIGGSGTDTRTMAGFVDATYEIVPSLFLTAGVRYSHDSVKGAYYDLPTGVGVVTPVPVPSISSNHWTPRAVLRYKPDDQSSIYASFTRGYKAALIDVGGSCQNPVNFPTPQNPTGAGYICNDVRPESINSYEVGYKFDNRRISFEVSGFYYDYKNLQVSEYLAGRANIINAATSKIYGIDGQASFRVSDQFEVNAGGAWTHARYKHFENAPIYTRCPTYDGCGGGTSFYLPPGVMLDNVTMQRAPSFTGTVGAKYTTELSGGNLALTSNLYYSSKFYFGPSGIQFPQKGYALLSLRGQWTDPSDRFTIAVFGDNVTNTHYKTEVQYSSFGIGTNWAKPVTFGVELGFKFGG